MYTRYSPLAEAVTAGALEADVLAVLDFDEDEDADAGADPPL